MISKNLIITSLAFLIHFFQGCTKPNDIKMINKEFDEWTIAFGLNDGNSFTTDLFDTNEGIIVLAHSFSEVKNKAVPYIIYVDYNGEIEKKIALNIPELGHIGNAVFKDSDTILFHANTGNISSKSPYKISEYSISTGKLSRREPTQKQISSFSDHGTGEGAILRLIPYSDDKVLVGFGYYRSPVLGQFYSNGEKIWRYSLENYVPNMGVSDVTSDENGQIYALVSGGVKRPQIVVLNSKGNYVKSINLPSIDHQVRGIGAQKIEIIKDGTIIVAGGLDNVRSEKQVFVAIINENDQELLLVPGNSGYEVSALEVSDKGMLTISGQIEEDNRKTAIWVARKNVHVNGGFKPVPEIELSITPIKLPCEHVYKGKRYLETTRAGFENEIVVLSFSNSSGKATIYNKLVDTTAEISCHAVPE